MSAISATQQQANATVPVSLREWRLVTTHTLGMNVVLSHLRWRSFLKILYESFDLTFFEMIFFSLGLGLPRGTEPGVSLCGPPFHFGCVQKRIETDQLLSTDFSNGTGVGLATRFWHTPVTGTVLLRHWRKGVCRDL
jgi:hypothetical protein